MTIPSRDPANESTLFGVLTDFFSKRMQATDDMLPARVVAFDRASNLATVQPLIQMVTTDNTRISRPQIAAVPVLQIGGGNFLLSFPLSPGDLGWIKANDRDISLFLEAWKETAPNTKRMHSFSDAVFIPDAMTGFTIAGEDSNNATLQTKNSTNRVAVSSSAVKMTAGSNYVKVDATQVQAQVGTTSLVVTSSGITLTVGGTTMTMNSSGITTSGTWTHTGTMTANGIGLASHHHVEHDGPSTGAAVA